MLSLCTTDSERAIPDYGYILYKVATTAFIEEEEKNYSISQFYTRTTVFMQLYYFWQNTLKCNY